MKPVAYYKVQTVQRRIAQAEHGKSHLAADAQALWEQRIDAAMIAQGWKRTAGTCPRYEKPLVPKLNGLHAALVTWLQTQHQAVYHTELMRRATTYAFDRAYDVPLTASAEYKQPFQPILDALPDALRIVKFETTATNGVYPPQPLAISAAMIQQSYVTLDTLAPISTKQGDVLLYNDVLRALATTLGIPQKELTDLKMQQVCKVLLNRWLQRKRYEEDTFCTRPQPAPATAQRIHRLLSHLPSRSGRKPPNRTWQR